MTFPTRMHPIMATAAIDTFLGDANWRRRSSDYGWRIVRRDPLTLLVTLTAPALNGPAETYLLRLDCAYYPAAPPDAQFVNPDTERYDPAADRRHLPQLRAPYCYVHPNYAYQPPYVYGPQLVCSSMTLGYYFSGHNPKEHQRWDPTRHTIGTTIWTIYKALCSPDYLGREEGWTLTIIR